MIVRDSLAKGSLILLSAVDKDTFFPKDILEQLGEYIR